MRGYITLVLVSFALTISAQIVIGVGSSSTSVSLSGDASGISSNNVVGKIQGFPVSPNTPFSTQVMGFDGNIWKPTYLTAGQVYELQNAGDTIQYPFPLFGSIAYVDDDTAYVRGAYNWLPMINGGSSLDQTLFSDPQTFTSGALSHNLSGGVWSIDDGTNEWIKFDNSTDIFSTKKHFKMGSTHSVFQTNNTTSGSSILITNNGVTSVSAHQLPKDGQRVTYINAKTNNLSFDVNTISPTTISGDAFYTSEAGTSASFEYDATSDNWYLICETGIVGSSVSNEIILPVTTAQTYTKTNPFYLADTTLEVGSYRVEAYVLYSSGATYSGDSTFVEFTGSNEIRRGEFEMESWQFNPPQKFTVTEDIESLPYEYSTGSGGGGANLMFRYVEFIINVQSSGQFTIKMGAENFTHEIKEGSYCFIKAMK